MHSAHLRPSVQIFVCTNRRAADDPLKSGCGEAGLPLFQALKRTVGLAGRMNDIWITRTGCLGHCPTRGCSVVVYPDNQQWVEATERDADTIASSALATTRNR